MSDKLFESEVIVILAEIRDAMQRLAEAQERKIRTEWARTPEGIPICPKHRVPMPLREKQGDSWHSHAVVDPQTGEKLYCRGYRSKSGPGWFIEEPANLPSAPQEPDPPPQRENTPSPAPASQENGSPAAPPATNGEELFDYHFANGDAVPAGQHAAFNDYRRQFGEGAVTPTDFYTWLKQRPAPSGNHQRAGRADGNFDLDAANDELFG